MSGDLSNVERLRMLHAVWRRGSLAAAAELLHVTPSAISQQLTKLEREAGTGLLVRHGRGVRLTPAGLLLAQRSDRVLAELRAARADLDSLTGETTGVVEIGAIPSGVHTFITPALTGLAVRHPGIEARLHEVEPEVALPALADGVFDVVVVESWENLPLTRPPATRWTELRDDSAMIVLPAGHPLAGADSVRAEDLAEEIWVAWARPTLANAWIRQTLRERGIEPVVRHTVSGFGTQFAVVAGLGAVTLVPSMATTIAPSTVVCAPLEPVLHRQLYAVQPQGETRPAVAECVTALVEAARSWGS
ncbi:LysR family transcriptional regulator [Amycolatopsis decaplanina]|uniref:LysR family transcriptional regulator n=1 Tax=Amycolatopsis decaplanina TaxID=208441 RepID=UPI00034CE0E3|nr:LysR family transcriptional regulator [Amycolatopsis decaplanina]